VFELYDLLACPRCGAPLERQGERLSCTAASCAAEPRVWPIVRGVPVLFDQTQGLLSVSALAAQAGEGRGGRQGLLSRVFRARPRLSRNLAAAGNYRRLASLLQERRQGVVLVVGCGEGGVGFRNLAQAPGVRLVRTDVRWTRCVEVLCDAHQLPFKEESFDAVVVQAVLEHVLDPWKAVSETTRVLKAGGLVYSEWPFLQPTHGGAFDFTRLTHLGHRRMWRSYEELASGVCGGPGMALAQVTQAFARCLLPGRLWPKLSDFVTDWTLWWLKYLDLWLGGTPAGMDAACGFYFLGRKQDRLLEDSQLVRQYRGAQK